MDYEGWLGRAKITIESNIRPGVKFEVRHLFPLHEWEDLSRGERISFGRYFADAVREGRLGLVSRCENGKNRHNQYIKH